MEFVQIKGLSFAKLLAFSSRLTLVHPENECPAKVGGRPFDESRSFQVMQCSIQASISHQWRKKSVLRALGKLRWKGILAKGLWRLCYCTIPHPFGVGSFSQSWRQWNFECSMLGLPKIRRPQVRGRRREIHRTKNETKRRCFSLSCTPSKYSVCICTRDGPSLRSPSGVNSKTPSHMVTGNPWGCIAACTRKARPVSRLDELNNIILSFQNRPIKKFIWLAPSCFPG